MIMKYDFVVCMMLAMLISAGLNTFFKYETTYDVLMIYYSNNKIIIYIQYFVYGGLKFC